MFSVTSGELYKNHLIFVYRAFRKFNQYGIPLYFRSRDSITDGSDETSSIPMFKICKIPQPICKEIWEHVTFMLNTKKGQWEVTCFWFKIKKKPKELDQVQFQQKKKPLRYQASIWPRCKSFSKCSHTKAIAFKLDIFGSCIKKTERRNSEHALALILGSKTLSTKNYHIFYILIEL